MSPRLVVLALLCPLILLAACGGSSAPKEPTGTPGPKVTVLPRVQLAYGSGNLLVEVALTPPQLEMGLGYRDTLFDRGGMLFDLSETRPPWFWMKGMRFPLDMLWITDDKKVAEITADVQPEPGIPDDQLRHYAPATPVRYVLELNAGAAAKFGIGVGQQLTFEIPATLRVTPAAATGTAPATP